MSLLCFKNCRDSATLLDMPTDQLLKKRIFDSKNQNHEKDDKKSIPEIRIDPPYEPWDEKDKEPDPHGDASKTQDRVKDVVQQKRNNEGQKEKKPTEKEPKTSYDSDEFSHINAYSKKVMAVTGEKQPTDDKTEEKNDGLFRKFGNKIASLLKRKDSEDKNPEPESPNGNGYEAGESASESNFSVISEGRFWSYEERSGERRGIQEIDSHRGRYDDEEPSGVVRYRRWSTDAGQKYIDDKHNSVELRNGSSDGRNTSGKFTYNSPWSDGSFGGSDGSFGVDTSDGSRIIGTMDNYRGLRRMHWSTTAIRSNRSPSDEFSRSVRAPTTMHQRQFTRSERKYASTGNLTDCSSSTDSNTRTFGTPSSYRSFQPAGTSRRPRSSNVTPSKDDVRKRNSERHMSDNNKSRAMSNEVDGSRRLLTKGDVSRVMLDLDFDYKAESSRLYVILKSLSGLTSKKTAGKTNVRVHLIVMPERLQRAYTRRKSEGWTIRFMEKFRFSDISSLNSIAFKVVLNDGSTKEKLIGTKAVHMKELNLSKGKQNLTVEINQHPHLETHH